MCDNGMSCFGASDCNIQDLVKAELEAEKEANGDTDDNVTDNEPIMAVDDPKRSNFCGSKCVLSLHIADPLFLR